MFSYNNNNYKKYNISNGLLNYKLSKDYLSTSINIFNIYGLFLYEIYSWKYAIVECLQREFIKCYDTEIRNTIVLDGNTIHIKN